MFGIIVGESDDDNVDKEGGGVPSLPLPKREIKMTHETPAPLDTSLVERRLQSQLPTILVLS